MSLPLAIQQVQELQARLQNLGPLFQQIAAGLEQSGQLRFDTKTDPDGKAWAPWSPATAAERAAEGRGTLLEYTGRMRDSLGSAFGPTFAEVFLGVPYAGAHEFGMGQARRSVLHGANGGMGAADEIAILKIVEDYFNA